MDPLTLSVHRFHEALRVRLTDPPPGVAPASETGATRLVIDGVSPDQLLKSLRLYEYREDNRHPFIVFTDRVDSEAQFVAAALAQLAGDEASVRKGLAEEHIALARTELPTEIQTAAGLAACVKRVAAAVAEVLAGIVVVLAPSRIGNQPAYERIASALAGQATCAQVVVLIADIESPALRGQIPDVVPFRIDKNALIEHATNLKSPNNVGPARANQPKLTRPQRRALEHKLGRRLAGRPTGEAFRKLLLDAGAAQGEGKFELAAKKFRAARTLCHLTGQRAEEAMCAIAVGTSHFSANRLDRAMEAYREALALAINLKAPRLIMQAELAIATTHLTVKDYPSARAAYARTYLAAAGLPTMQIEALRMQGECFIGEQNAADAVLIWLRALDEVEALEPMVAGVTSFRMLGKRLEEELAGAGQRQRIAETQRRTSAIEQRATRAVTPASQEVQA